jgi:two-component system chemotaxis response regulator CheB
MFSTLTERAAAATLEALALGATDYVTKPANVGSLAAAMDAVRAQLLPKIKALCPRLVGSATPSAGSPPVSTPAPRPSTEAAPPPSPVRPMPDGRRRVPAIVAIGASTGGPDALATVFASLPSLDIPIVVVQHMPPVFTRLFAQRLDRVAKFAVREAENGEPLRAGVALIAPGDHHLSLASSNGTVRAVLTQTPPVNFCRPAVDVLFSSVAEIYGDRTLAVMLTGMGHDGLRGCQALRARHAEIVAQDAATSVVWGMPGAVANAGLADRILPLTAIAPDISSTIYRGRVATAGVTG